MTILAQQAGAVRGNRARHDTHRFLAEWKADAERTTGKMQQSASEHGDACVNSVQDRGSIPLASSYCLHPPVDRPRVYRGMVF